jgi:hypothetical protein
MKRETGGLGPLHPTNIAQSISSEGCAMLSLSIAKSGSFIRLVWPNLAAQAAERIRLTA